MTQQLALIEVEPIEVRILDEDEEREEDVSTCRTPEARRASLRATLLGMAGRNNTALALAGAYLKQHGDLARVVLRRAQWGPNGRLLSVLEEHADQLLEQAGVPEEVQTTALL